MTQRRSPNNLNEKVNVMKLNQRIITCTALILGALTAQQALAAISLDRTRVIYNGSERSISLSISNENKTLPYLAQSWLENAQGIKVNSPLLVLPPVQRVEPGQKSAIKIQGLHAVKMLPQDRESLFYFNLREIPPRSDKANVLQIALQTRIKLFYRPEAIAVKSSEEATPWQNQLTLTKQGDGFKVTNPTPYYITLVGAGANKEAQKKTNFKPLMIEPKSSATLGINAAVMGAHPVLTYINDYGGRPTLSFNCSAAYCRVDTQKSE